MSTRPRKLVQRTRQHEESSPVPRSRQRDSQAGSRPREAPRQLTTLPPYEPPSCPLSAAARQELDTLRLNYDYSKYRQHLMATKGNLTNTTADAHDRLRARKEEVEKEANKRRKDGSNEKTEAELEAEERADTLEAQVMDMTERAEKAMREMIDYSDELAMNDTIMRDVSESIPPAPAAQPVRRRERPRVDDDMENEEPLEEEMLMEVPDVRGVSTIVLLQQAKEEYATNYASKSMRVRYENTDYATFKRTIHESQHGRDGPPPPHARTWFTEDGGVATGGSSRRRTNANDDVDSDDDIVIARATVNLKCPLTLQYFKEPYSNKVCKHSFEKSAILEYHRKEAVAYQDPSQRGRNRQPIGPKAVKCPQTGCNAMIELKDFFDDTLLLRQVKRAEKEAAREFDEEDDEEDDAAPRGTQKGRPEEIDSEVEIDDDEYGTEQRRQHILKVKRERGQSRGLSIAPSHRQESSEPSEDDADEMEVE